MFDHRHFISICQLKIYRLQLLTNGCDLLSTYHVSGYTLGTLTESSLYLMITSAQQGSYYSIINYMSKLRLKDDRWPAQAYIDLRCENGNLVWIPLSQNSVILSWDSTNLYGSVKAPVIWEIFAIRVIESKPLSNMKNWRSDYFGKVMFQPTQNLSFMEFTCSLSSKPCTCCSLCSKKSRFFPWLPLIHLSVILLSLPITLWAATKSCSALYP